MDTEQVLVFIHVVDCLSTIGRDLATDLVRHASLALGARVLQRGRRDSTDAAKDATIMHWRDGS